ncbi:MmcQ/YjbR family DNA-binding protein [Embleya sp. NBC_00896]|uniref:MmcQ/YjbR family DNA-binding protein n=1 Tax=Embleya sp. NBC_00896 TaxID=2975961 RepID=UPI002F90B4D7|nr:MmcQ/YjbR family DNA-binding protein [Embleya sp. NBC_00896]
MTAERLKSMCLAFNGAGEEFPFARNPELSTFKVGGKIFAFTVLTDPLPLRVSLKCDPELAVRLRADHPAIVGGWHLNKRHWNTVTLDGSLPESMVRDMIEDSYDLIVAALPKLVRLKLDWPGREAGRDTGRKA